MRYGPHVATDVDVKQAVISCLQAIDTDFF